jgi:transcriptional regulator with XRE-family HTH domain
MPKRRVPRWRPQHLAAKLLGIRQHLGLSQSRLIECLDLDRVDLYLETARISEYEHGTREPNLMVLLSYARVARVRVESLIDDNLDLPF